MKPQRPQVTKAILRKKIEESYFLISKWLQNSSNQNSMVFVYKHIDE